MPVSKPEIEESKKQVVPQKENPKVDSSFLDISTYNGSDTGKYKWS